MKTNYITYLFLLLCCTFTLSGQDQNTNVLSKHISQNTTLLKSQTYSYTDDIYISNNATLTIEEGVIFKCNEGKHLTFIIEGGSKVIASGTEALPILINSDSTIVKKPIIMVKSPSGSKNNIASFSYKRIDNPTIIMNQNPSKKSAVSNRDDEY